MTATLLVLGASGFLGPHIVLAGAKSKGFGRVVAACRRPGELSVPGCSFDAVPWDGLFGEETAELVARVRPAGIVTTAALSRLDACEEDPGSARAANVELALGVARAARATGARLVHVSTDLVFGGAPPVGARYAESDPPSPLSVYGRTKAEGEEAVRTEYPAALVCRLPLLFGDSHGRGLGASDSLVAAVRRGEEPLLFEDEWRTPLDVAFAARALVELAMGDRTGPLHVAGPDRLSRSELGLLALRAAGFAAAETAARVRFGRRAERDPRGLRPVDVSLDASAARELLVTPLPAPAESLGIDRSA